MSTTFLPLRPFHRPVAAARPADHVRTLPERAGSAPTPVELPWAIARDGIAAHEAAVGALVRTATEAGMVGAALRVLADSRAPAVARERAFGIVTAALSQHSAAAPPGLLAHAFAA